MAVARATEGELDELLALMRDYCVFYEAAPPDEGLEHLARALLDSERDEGVQLLARNDEGRAVGFATVLWMWSTLRTVPIGFMNDLYVVPDARGVGAGRALIAACAQACRDHGACSLDWQTARDNATARGLYDAVGAKSSDHWVDYSLALDA